MHESKVIYGLITKAKENPIILIIGTNESEVRKKVDESAGALFKCNFSCCLISFTGLHPGFEPSKKHYEQVRNYVSLMMQNKYLPDCEVNVGDAKVVC